MLWYLTAMHCYTRSEPACLRHNTTLHVTTCMQEGGLASNALVIDGKAHARISSDILHHLRAHAACRRLLRWRTSAA